MNISGPESASPSEVLSASHIPVNEASPVQSFIDPEVSTSSPNLASDGHINEGAHLGTQKSSFNWRGLWTTLYSENSKYPKKRGGETLIEMKNIISIYL